MQFAVRSTPKPNENVFKRIVFELPAPQSVHKVFFITINSVDNHKEGKSWRWYATVDLPHFIACKQRSSLFIYLRCYFDWSCVFTIYLLFIVSQWCDVFWTNHSQVPILNIQKYFKKYSIHSLLIDHSPKICDCQFVFLHFICLFFANIPYSTEQTSCWGERDSVFSFIQFCRWYWRPE